MVIWANWGWQTRSGHNVRRRRRQSRLALVRQLFAFVSSFYCLVSLVSIHCLDRAPSPQLARPPAAAAHRRPMPPGVPCPPHPTAHPSPPPPSLLPLCSTRTRCTSRCTKRLNPRIARAAALAPTYQPHLPTAAEAPGTASRARLLGGGMPRHLLVAFHLHPSLLPPAPLRPPPATPERSHSETALINR